MEMAEAIITGARLRVEDSLVITDPCYVQETTELTDLSVDIPQAQGIWIAETELSDEGTWGRRVSRLRLRKSGDSFRDSYRLEHIGVLGVDSGRMYAGCATNLPLDYNQFVVEQRQQDYPNCTVFGGGIVCSSGYGDGLYGCYANQNRSLIEVRFLDDPDAQENQ